MGTALSLCLWLATSIYLLSPHPPVTEDKINALIRAADVEAEPFWPGLSAKAPGQCQHQYPEPHLQTKRCGPTPAGSPAPSTEAALAEEKELEAKKGESEEFDEDLQFGLFA